jgi:hypothetical protein
MGLVMTAQGLLINVVSHPALKLAQLRHTRRIYVHQFESGMVSRQRSIVPPPVMRVCGTSNLDDDGYPDRAPPVVWRQL